MTTPTRPSVAAVAIRASVRRRFTCRTCGATDTGDRFDIELAAGALRNVERLIEREAARRGNNDMPIGWCSYHLPTGFAYVCPACPHP